jgi:hypothetical protein
MMITRHCQLQEDCVAGQTKLFIGSPKTVFRLEELRATEIPRLVILLQKVVGLELIMIMIESRRFPSDVPWHPRPLALQTSASRTHNLVSLQTLQTPCIHRRRLRSIPVIKNQ